MFSYVNHPYVCWYAIRSALLDSAVLLGHFNLDRIDGFGHERVLAFQTIGSYTFI